MGSVLVQGWAKMPYLNLEHLQMMLLARNTRTFQALRFTLFQSQTWAYLIPLYYMNLSPTWVTTNVLSVLDKVEFTGYASKKWIRI